MKRLRGSRGAGAIELAIIAPLLLLFLISAAQVGLVVLGNSVGSNAAREGVRVASIHFKCADHVGAALGLDNPADIACPTNLSSDYTLIKAAVVAKLVGLVKPASVTVGVVCRQGSSTGLIIACENATPDADVVAVAVGWNHIGGTTFVTDGGHSSTARSLITGTPDFSGAAAPPPDFTPPGLVPPILAKDPNRDGIIDTLTLTFNEDIVQSAATSAFTVANNPSGWNTVATVSVSARVVTLTLSGTGSTKNTAPGSMTVALASSASGVVDPQANRASFAATTTADAAGPIITAMSDAQPLLGVDARIDALDALTITFSEPIGTSLGAVSIAESDPSTTANDSVSIPGVTAGPQLTNSNLYNTVDNSSFTASATITKSGNNVVITVLSPLVCVPIACTGRGTGSDDTNWAFTPATTLLDSAGNAAGGSFLYSKIF